MPEGRTRGMVMPTTLRHRRCRTTPTKTIYTKNKLAPYAIALCVFIAFTRLYLYVHFPTDVLAGAVFGSLIGYVAFRIANALDARRPLKTK